ncbi:arylsulfatase [Novosphingobium beihaiensis]|uniref:Arylsulfatase n=1 Tax=Novosphingobium beihaiensis TaxID=2930389 RepID=A0ABT0BQ35_9SPHN|nr:arylsulfatase [Novosphingobium beihaiensis]MCJ2186946.1 arylsulfatase [Novosphingobium beihaiensis]
MIEITRRKFVGTLMAATALSSAGKAFAATGPRKRPNVITVVLDDVGYSDIGCYGSEIRTPNMDRLAEGGLRFVHFDTKAVCASTRAAFLTGRNSHTINMPDVPDIAAALPPAQTKGLFSIPRNARNIAEVLGADGYETWALGKWHLIPNAELDEHGGRSNWPLQRGFKYFYGFPRGWTDQYNPTLVEGNDYIHPELPEDYHLSADLADKAIGLIGKHRESGSSAPFYLNLAFGAAHAPIQVPREYSKPYDEVYAKGWDAIREQRHKRMLAMGVIPEDTKLTPRSDEDRAWADLSDAEKTVFARYMAVYAGFLEHCDQQLGRVLDFLEAQGLAEDTLIVLFSDNGAASEAGQTGNFDQLYRPSAIPVEEQLRRIDDIGTPRTQAEYPRPWALAGDTPLRRYKLWPYSGGTRTPMIVRWPGHVDNPGGVRRQYVDCIDIAPTVIAAAGARFEPVIDGVAQIPVAGRSFLPMLTDASAEGRKVQYFELRGNRAITDGRWRAVTTHDCDQPSFANDEWQLFDLDTDFSEAANLAAKEPKRLKAMQALWQSEWDKYGNGPLTAPGSMLCKFTRGLPI